MLTVEPYRWLMPEDSSRVLRLVDAICTGSVDAVTFTSAPAVDALFNAADGVGKLEAVLDAFSEIGRRRRGRARSRPLRFALAGIEPIQPDRYRMGALIRLVCEHLEEKRIVASAHPTRPGRVAGPTRRAR